MENAFTFRGWILPRGCSAYPDKILTDGGFFHTIKHLRLELKHKRTHKRIKIILATQFRGCSKRHIPLAKSAGKLSSFSVSLYSQQAALPV